MSIKQSIRMVALLACVMPGLVLAQGKIAVVSLQEAVLNTDVAQQRMKELRDQPDVQSTIKRVEELQTQGQELIEKVKKDQAIMSEEQLMESRKRIEAIQADIQHYGKQLQKTEQEEFSVIMQELGPRLQQVLNELIKNEGLGLLLIKERAGVYFVDSSYDLTSKVTDKLNQGG